MDSNYFRITKVCLCNNISHLMNNGRKWTLLFNWKSKINLRIVRRRRRKKKSVQPVEFLHIINYCYLDQLKSSLITNSVKLFQIKFLAFLLAKPIANSVSWHHTCGIHDDGYRKSDEKLLSFLAYRSQQAENNMYV